MPFPNFENKHSETALFNPDDFIKYATTRNRLIFEPPESVIFCYQHSLMDHILENHETTDTKRFGGLYLLDETRGKVGVIGKFGVGAPVAVGVLEELIGFGVRKFISIGSAGSLQNDLDIGDIVVCDRAIRDEGTSHHYLPNSKYAHASEDMTRKIKDSLDRQGQKYLTGTSWTTDAIYRETIAEVKQYQKEGILTVEMEASALFAVAEYRNVPIGAILTISDSLADLVWKPEFHSDETKKGLEILYKAALDVLLNEAEE